MPHRKILVMDPEISPSCSASQPSGHSSASSSSSVNSALLVSQLPRHEHLLDNSRKVVLYLSSAVWNPLRTTSLLKDLIKPTFFPPFSFGAMERGINVHCCDCVCGCVCVCVCVCTDFLLTTQYQCERKPLGVCCTHRGIGDFSFQNQFCYLWKPEWSGLNQVKSRGGDLNCEHSTFFIFIFLKHQGRWFGWHRAKDSGEVTQISGVYPSEVKIGSGPVGLEKMDQGLFSTKRW